MNTPTEAFTTMRAAQLTCLTQTQVRTLARKQGLGRRTFSGWRFSSADIRAMRLADPRGAYTALRELAEQFLKRGIADIGLYHTVWFESGGVAVNLRVDFTIGRWGGYATGVQTVATIWDKRSRTAAEWADHLQDAAFRMIKRNAWGQV